MKHNGPPHFQLVIDYWGTRSDTKLLLMHTGHHYVFSSGFSCNNYVTLKVNKQVEGKVRNFNLDRDQRMKKQGNKGTAENCRTSKVAIPTDILVNI